MFRSFFQQIFMCCLDNTTSNHGKQVFSFQAMPAQPPFYLWWELPTQIEKSHQVFFVLEPVIPNLFYLHITSHQNLNSQTPALNNLLPVSILPLQRRVHLLCPPKIHIVSFHFIMYIYEKKSLNNFSSCCNGYFQLKMNAYYCIHHVMTEQCAFSRIKQYSKYKQNMNENLIYIIKYFITFFSFF